ncbi:MAG: hypothetical protein QNK27_07505 [Desulfuromusa sp.]|nr:hypothetical protein [Desulfuromusa sp.]
MNNKGYSYIPRALFDAIIFLVQVLPKRSVPARLELLFGRCSPKPVLSLRPFWLFVPGAIGPVIIDGCKKAIDYGFSWDCRRFA